MRIFRRHRKDDKIEISDGQPGHSWETYVEPGVTGPVSPEAEFKILVAEKRREDSADGVQIHFQAALYCYFSKHGVIYVGTRAYPHEAGWARIGTAAETSADLIGQEKEHLSAQMEEAKNEFNVTREQLNQRWRNGEFSGSLEGRAKYEDELEVARTICRDKLNQAAERWNELNDRARSPQRWSIAQNLPEAMWPAATPIEQLASAWADYREKIREINLSEWQRQADARAQGAALEAQALAHEQELESQRQVADLLPGPTVDGASSPASAR